jgi:DNA-binding MarR family transcriptional regulator
MAVSAGLYSSQDDQLVSMVAKYVNMADIKSEPKNREIAVAREVPDEKEPIFLREEEIRQGIELLFFAYRDFTAEPDAILEEYAFGRAHHRVVHFVGRNPLMTVGELLGILRITKQSLNRVLGQLVRQGFIIQHRGPQDRRQRLLELTEKGHELERRLLESQLALVGAAYRKAGGPAVDGFRKVLLGIIGNDSDRRRFERPRPPKR